MTSVRADPDVVDADWPRRVAETLVCAALAVLPYLVRVVSGTRRLPNDDNWAYVRIFDELQRTGELVLVDWNDINLVGIFPLSQVWAFLVGDGPLQLHFLGSVMGFVVLMSLVSALRSVGASDTFLPVVALGVFIGFVGTAGTYMADLFALAGSASSLALALAVAARRRSDLAAALLVGGSVLAALFAFSVRQQTIIAAGVVGLVLLLAPRVPRWAWVGFGAAYGVGIVPFYLWRSGLENGGSPILGVSPRAAAVSVLIQVALVAAAMLPVVVRDHGFLVDKAVALRIVSGVVAGAAFAVVDIGDYASDPLILLARVADANAGVRFVLGALLANVGVTVALGVWRRRLDLSDRLRLALGIGLLVTAVADVAVVVLGSAYYARYSMFLIVLAFVVWACSEPSDGVRSSESVRGAWVVVAMIGLSSYWMLDRDVTAIRVSMDGADVAACAGVPPEEVDAGFVWMGTHYEGVSVARYQDQPEIDDGLPASWYHRIFPDSERTVLVTEDRPEEDDVAVVGHVSRSGLLPGNSADRWIVVRSDDTDLLAGCTEPPG